jgi:hypothetical protein
MGMASVSGGFSVYGFTIIFGGYFWPIVAMGCFLEACKLSAVAWLGHHHGSPSRLRPWLVGLVAVLMCLNAIGCFGFLVRAHVAHQAAGETTVAVRLAEIESKITVQAAAVADIDRQLAQLDGAIEKGISRGKINGAMQLANEKRGDRTKLQVERLTAARLLVDLKVEKAKIEGERRTVEADLGPVKYFAEFFGAGDETVMRYFILVLAALLDPAAVLLLLAAAAPRTASAARS